MAQEKIILLAEDDENDALLFKIALEHAAITNPLTVVRDGREAIDYLRGTGSYSDRNEHPLPALMLLDLNMPLLNGFDVLLWRHKQPELRELPIVVMSSSHSQEDIQRALSLGAASYCIKPAGLQYLIQVARELRDRWLNPARQPDRLAPLQLMHSRRRALESRAAA
jgi:CheY-like chemotaxis protein